MKNCGTCVWIDKPSDHLEYSECHGVPPGLAGDEYSEDQSQWIPRFYWPRVFTTTIGCGLHKEESDE